MTWEQMCILEPKLLGLLVEAQKKPKADHCKQVAWGGVRGKTGKVGLKELMCQLVGHGAAVPELQNGDAYDIAYRKLYAAVAPCQHDGDDCKYNYPADPTSIDRDFGPFCIEPLTAKLRRAGRKTTHLSVDFKAKQ